MTAVATPVSTERVAFNRILSTGAIAAVVAAIANLILYFIASGALGIEFNLTPADQPAPPFAIPVIFASVIGIALATFAYWLVGKFLPRPITTYRIVGVIALVLSFAPLFGLSSGGMPGVAVPETGTLIVLGLMHVIAGVVTIWLLTTRARES